MRFILLLFPCVGRSRILRGGVTDLQEMRVADFAGWECGKGARSAPFLAMR